MSQHTALCPFFVRLGYTQSSLGQSSRWEHMRLNFALLASLEPTAKGQCFQTAAQSLLVLDLSRSAPG